MISAEFVEGGQGPVFVVLRRPAGIVRGCVLLLPPFAEEMNKSRALLAQLAHRLAQQGMASVMLDLYGTGDSGGDFVDGNWALWQQDVIRVSQWCASQGMPVSAVLAVRLGAALAVSDAVLAALLPLTATVFWQPVFDGRRALTQFLRLRVAASALSGERKETVAELKQLIHAKGSAVVAGYRLSRQLVAELDALVPASCLPPQLGVVRWMEMIAQPGNELPEQSIAMVERSRVAGSDVCISGFACEPFWAATELVRNDVLIEATAGALTTLYAGAGA